MKKFDEFFSNVNKFWLTIAQPQKASSLVDVSNKPPEEIFESAYTFAQQGNYQKAAQYLIQAPAKVFLKWKLLPELTFEQLCGVTLANPVCCSRLLSDLRSQLLFDSLGKIHQYLRIAPDSAKVFFEQQRFLDMIDDHESLGLILQAAPTICEYLIVSKGLGQLICYESNLLDLAQEASSAMEVLLRQPRVLGLVQKAATVNDLICSAPSLYTLLDDPRIIKLMAGYPYYDISCQLGLKASSGDKTAQKALGLLFWYGKSIFPCNKKLGLHYLEQAAPHDSTCAAIVGKEYLERLNTYVEKGNWVYDEALELQQKIPKTSEAYCPSLETLTHLIWESISNLDPSNLQEKVLYLKEALVFLVEAYEIKPSEITINLLDHSLSLIYLGKTFLQGRLEDNVRSNLITRFKEEQSQKSEICFFGLFSSNFLLNRS